MKKIVIAIAAIFIFASFSGCVEKDKEPPSIKISLDGKENNGWYRSNVTIKINAIDNKSGIKEVKYRLDWDIWKDYIKPVVIRENGEHLFEYYAKDKNGNIAYRNVTIKIDKIKPKISFENFEPGYLYFRGKKYPILRIPKDTMIVGKMDIIVNANDSISGIQKVEFYLGKKIILSLEKQPYRWSIDKTIGVYNITALAYDNAGNINSITIPNVQIFIMR